MRRALFVEILLLVGALVVLSITPGACWANETVFSGGTLDDLRQLSPNLTFDHLRITGPLRLSVLDSASLTVNRLTITSSGSVGYTYSECTYMTAPNFSVEANGRVVIE